MSDPLADILALTTDLKNEGYKPPPRVVGPERYEVERAIATVDFSRETHVVWRDYLRDHVGGCGGCGRDHRKDVDVAGDQAYHQKAIDDYDQVLRVLRSLL